MVALDPVAVCEGVGSSVTGGSSRGSGGMEPSVAGSLAVNVSDLGRSNAEY